MIQNVLIIEDEKPNADRLKRLIHTAFPQLNILAVLECVGECIEWFRENEHPDVVMMDVRLSDGLSFEIFEKVEIKSPVIFTTAYDEYAVRAFKYNSIDYLLKPVDPKELQAAFEKLMSQNTQGTPSLEGLLNFLQPKTFRTRFLLPYKDGYKTLLVSDVAYFYSEFKITRVKLYTGSEEVVPHTLEELEQQLDSKLFFRANRQFIIHIDAIQQVHNHFNGKLKIDIKNNPETEIIVSREKAGLLKNWLDF
ncbi:LytTR family DNA-binding domain-containing protein [Fluviicola sp.]|uniref:LytR/AlgR family response regulator transcription factor n=1 Tax=Fluviicola sp. TaxID=1917219 RepID=UPI00261696D6|nr:LytTR family DNA-binding domain-containing protein [Fluviicola sp.]